MIVGLGDIYVQILRREEVRELMRATQASVREEPGCISYAFTETLDDPGHFVVVERWRDQAAVDEHYGSQAFAEYQSRINRLLVRSSELSLHVVAEGYRPLGSTPPSTPVED